MGTSDPEIRELVAVQTVKFLGHGPGRRKRPTGVPSFTWRPVGRKGTPPKQT